MQVGYKWSVEDGALPLLRRLSAAQQIKLLLDGAHPHLTAHLHLLKVRAPPSSPGDRRAAPPPHLFCSAGLAQPSRAGARSGAQVTASLKPRTAAVSLLFLALEAHWSGACKLLAAQRRGAAGWDAKDAKEEEDKDLDSPAKAPTLLQRQVLQAFVESLDDDDVLAALLARAMTSVLDAPTDLATALQPFVKTLDVRPRVLDGERDALAPPGSCFRMGEPHASDPVVACVGFASVWTPLRGGAHPMCCACVRACAPRAPAHAQR